MSRLVLRETSTGKDVELARDASLKIRAQSGESFVLVDKDTGEEVGNLEFSLVDGNLGIELPTGDKVVIENYGSHPDSFPACPLGPDGETADGGEAIPPEALKAELMGSDEDGALARADRGENSEAWTLSEVSMATSDPSRQSAGSGAGTGSAELDALLDASSVPPSSGGPLDSLEAGASSPASPAGEAPAVEILAENYGDTGSAAQDLSGGDLLAAMEEPAGGPTGTYTPARVPIQAYTRDGYATPEQAEDVGVTTGMSGEPGFAPPGAHAASAKAAAMTMIAGSTLALTGIIAARPGKPGRLDVYEEEEGPRDDYGSYYLGLEKYDPGKPNWQKYQDKEEPKIYGPGGKIVQDAIDDVLGTDDEGGTNQSTNSVLPGRTGEGESSRVSSKLGLVVENGRVLATVDGDEANNGNLELVWLRDGQIVMDGDAPLTGRSYEIDPVLDAGKTITCELRAKLPASSDVVREGAAAADPADDLPELVIQQLDGALKAVLTGSDVGDVHFQWFRDGVLIEEGPGLDTHVIDPVLDAGGDITVKVFAVDDDLASGALDTPAPAATDGAPAEAAFAERTVETISENAASDGDFSESLSRLGSIRIGEIDENHSGDSLGEIHSIKLSGFSGFDAINIGQGPGGSRQIFEIDGKSIMDNVEAGGILRVSGVQGSLLKLSEGRIGDVETGLSENGVDKVSLEYIVDDASWTLLVDEALYNGGQGII